VQWPCFFGIDFPTREELIASAMNVDEVCASIGADSLAYLSMPGMVRATRQGTGLCLGCFTGDYPVAIPDSVAKKSLLTKKDFEETYGEGAADEARPRTR
ncbi:MAG: amidophosphoribosyltransferase, partial [Eggerthella sp.]|nr:amidophosphoribosyltransferase [Eggerthella sp.]